MYPVESISLDTHETSHQRLWIFWKLECYNDFSSVFITSLKHLYHLEKSEM